MCTYLLISEFNLKVLFKEKKEGAYVWFMICPAYRHIMVTYLSKVSPPALSCQL